MIRQQGKAFTSEQRESIIQSIQPYLELGFSRNKACEIIGLAPGTLSNWVKEDNALAIKLQSWENKINSDALAVIQNAIIKEKETGDIRAENSWKWAERKMKGEFSTRVENINDTKLTIEELPAERIEQIKNAFKD